MGALFGLLIFGGAAAIFGTKVGKNSEPDDLNVIAPRVRDLAPRTREIDTREPAPGQDADLTVFAPDYGSSRQSIVVQAIVHLPPDDQSAWKIAQGNDPDAKRLGSSPLAIQLKRNDLIKLTLEAESAAISEPVQSLHWNERMVCFMFDVRLPRVEEERTEEFRLRAAVNGVPVGRVLFKIRLGVYRRESPLVPTIQDSKPYKRAFLSYASQDRSQVLRAAQLIKALRLEYFQDILTLEPGDAWRQRLFSEIELCDVFLLFWSHHARESKWVLEEAEYALRLSKVGSDKHMEIIPVILEGPPAVAPPVALEEIHFNDSLRHIIFAEEAAAKARRDRYDRLMTFARFCKSNALLLIFGSLVLLANILLRMR